MKSRSLQGSYRWGAGGQEKDDEIAGEGNSYTAEYWEYDSRTGKRWNVDPVVSESESPYATFKNNPISMNDPGGDCADCPKDGEEGDIHVTDKNYGHQGVNGDLLNVPDGSKFVYVNVGPDEHGVTQWKLGGFELKDGSKYTWNSDKGWYTNEAGEEYDNNWAFDITNGVRSAMRPIVQMSIDGVSKDDAFASFKDAQKASGMGWSEFLWTGVTNNVSNLFAGGYKGQQAWLALWGGYAGMGGQLGVNAYSSVFNLSIKGIANTPLTALGMGSPLTLGQGSRFLLFNSIRGGRGFGFTIMGLKTEFLYANPSGGFGAGTFFSMKQLKPGGFFYRADYGLLHAGGTGAHLQYRFYLNGAKYGGTNPQFYFFKPWQQIKK